MGLIDFIMMKNLFGGSGGGSDSSADELIKKIATREQWVLKNDIVTEVREIAFRASTIVEAECPSVKTIGEEAFRGCSFLKTAYFDKVTEVGVSAFEGCTALLHVSMKNVTQIASSAFDGAVNLGFIQCESAERIEDNAFNNTNLTSITLKAITYIGNYAFSNCSLLRSIYIYNTSTVCVAEISAFSNTPLVRGEGHIYVPASMYEAYRRAYEPALEAGFFDVLFRKIED